MPLPPGTRLGAYEILGPLGAGGMGEVYKAHDARLERTVAVKVLPAHVASDPVLKQRFEREARALAALSHPHICQIYDVGRVAIEEGEIHFLVMEHLEGETLARRLGKGALALNEALACAIDLADALDKAHRKGVVHRDLKPGNVMMTRSGAKLVDFGLARRMATAPAAAADLTAAPTATSPLTGAGSIVGTFQYMAPEQLEGQDADARADIFAFGAVLYEMVTGRRAFTGSTQASDIASILKDTPSQPSTLQPLSPPSLDGTIATCLAKSPDDRWQSAGDIGRQLKLIQASSPSAPVSTSAVTSAIAPTSARPRWRRWAAIAAAIALAVAAGERIAPLLQRAPSPPAPVRFTVITPASFGQGSLAVSPDGRYIAFTAG